MITLEKEHHANSQINWNYSIYHNGILVGTCLVEVMDGMREHVLERYDAEEQHNCFDILKRIEEVDSLKLLHKIAFIRLLEIKEEFQNKGFGRNALSLILDELCQKDYKIVILDAFKGGFLIPFYESFLFERIPFPNYFEESKRTADNGKNFMWLKL